MSIFNSRIPNGAKSGGSQKIDFQDIMYPEEFKSRRIKETMKARCSEANVLYWEGDYSSTLEATGIGNPYYFTGRRIDFVGVSAFMIQYNRGRFYDYRTGRWLNQDPIGSQDGPNLYAYVHSNPVNRMDSFGLCADGPCLHQRVVDPREDSCEAICGERHPTYDSSYYYCIEECTGEMNPEFPQGSMSRS